MARFRTKPFEIDAILFRGDNFYEVQDFVGGRIVDQDHPIKNFQRAGTYRNWDDEDIVAEVYDKLHSTWVGVKIDQWIIKGAKGEFYPCDREIFEAKYDLVEKTDEVPAILEKGEFVTPKDHFSDHTLIEEDDV